MRNDEVYLIQRGPLRVVLDQRALFQLGEGDLIGLGRTLDLPTLNYESEADVLAPVAAVHHVGTLLEDVRLETAPGGHLGVLTGHSARTTTWEYLDAFLAEHDPLGAPRPTPARAV